MLKEKIKVISKKHVALLVEDTYLKGELIWCVYIKTIYNTGSSYYEIVNNTSGAFDNKSYCETFISYENGQYTFTVFREVELDEIK